MRTTRLTLGALAVTAALTLPAAPAFAQDDLNCDDFPSQAAAQAELRRDPSDPNDLDRNDNFVACERHPDYPAGSARDETPARPAVPVTETRTAQTATVRVPTRVDTGAGGSTTDAAVPAGAAAAGLTFAAVLASLHLRRRASS